MGFLSSALILLITLSAPLGSAWALESPESACDTRARAAEAQSNAAAPAAGNDCAQAGRLITGGMIPPLTLVPGYDPDRVNRAFSVDPYHFTCKSYGDSHYSESYGMSCTGTIPGGNEPVAIFIPPYFQPDLPSNVVLHLHGITRESSTASAFYDKFGFDGLLASSHSNSILVVPFSHKYTDSTLHPRLKTAAGFESFMAHVTTMLHSSGLQPDNRPRAITITGHSGAFNPITQILRQHCPTSDYSCARNRIRAVHLLDASYNAPQEFVDFALNPRHHFSVTYRPGTDTEGPATELQSRITRARHGVSPGSRDNGSCDDTVHFHAARRAGIGSPIRNARRNAPPLTPHEMVVRQYLPEVLASDEPADTPLLDELSGL